MSPVGRAKKGSKSTTAEHRIRIVATDGQRTDDLFWLAHRDGEVHYGVSDLKSHFSYHKSGKRHHTRPDGRDHFGQDEPLTQFRLHRTLMALPVPSRLRKNSKPYRARRKEAVVLIDLRPLPPRGAMVLLGLVEPRRLDALETIGRAFRPLYGPVRQTVLLTEVVPWVYVLVMSG